MEAGKGVCRSAACSSSKRLAVVGTTTSSSHAGLECISGLVVGARMVWCTDSAALALVEQVQLDAHMLLDDTWFQASGSGCTLIGAWHATLNSIIVKALLMHKQCTN